MPGPKHSYKLFEQEIDDAGEHFPVECVEDDDVIDPVDEFGPQLLLQVLEDPLLDRLEVRKDLRLVRFGSVDIEADVGDAVGEFLASDVRGHDDDRILEVHRPSLPVGQPSVIENLQEDIEDIARGLLDLIEEDDAVWLPPHRFGQLPSLVVADVSRRGSDEPRDRVGFHVFAHIDPDEGVLVIEELFGESLGGLGLSDSGRSEEEEASDRPFRVSEPGLVPLDRLAHEPERFILTDHTLLHAFVEMEVFLFLLLHQLSYGDPRPLRDDFGDIFEVDPILQEGISSLLILRKLVLD